MTARNQNRWTTWWLFGNIVTYRNGQHPSLWSNWYGKKLIRELIKRWQCTEE